MRGKVLDQLEAWHEEDEFDQIVETILEIPEEDRDYLLNSHLGRAMNNLRRYDEAIEIFKMVEEEGKGDPLWHYRIGIAYYYLDQYKNAQQAFETADQLCPEDEDTLEFLELLRGKLDEKPEVNDSEPVQVSPEKLHAEIREPHTESDLPDFWEDSEHAVEQYVLDPPTDEQIASVEEALVFKLPAFYIQMMKWHNGGVPRNRYFPVSDPGYDGYIEVSGILGVGRDKSRSLCGDQGSSYRVIHEGYPEFGVIIGECPAVNEVVMLDYRPFGNDGEPEVIHVNKENNYKITRLAPNFEAFVRGLVYEGEPGSGLES